MLTYFPCIFVQKVIDVIRRAQCRASCILSQRTHTLRTVKKTHDACYFRENRRFAIRIHLKKRAICLCIHHNSDRRTCIYRKDAVLTNFFTVKLTGGEYKNCLYIQYIAYSFAIPGGELSDCMLVSINFRPLFIHLVLFFYRRWPSSNGSVLFKYLLV